MVASRHPSSRPAGVGAPDRQIGLRPVSSRSPSRSVIGACRDQRPQLRLIVDNTVCDPRSAPVARSGPMDGGEGSEPMEGDPSSVATELGAWLKAAAGLAGARWRVARQRRINRHGHFAVSDRLEGLGPVVACVAVVVFGGLVGIRFAQESSRSPEDLGGTAGSIAAVATSTSGAASTSNLAAPAATGSTVVVHPGDSLWSIAVSRYPHHDPRVVVDAFVEVNGGSPIQAGQQLIVPAALLGR